MNANLQIFSATVKANQTNRVSATGKFLTLVSSSGTFNFSVDGGPFSNGLCIVGINFAADPTNTLQQSFSNILLQDTSGSANTVTFIASDAPITYINALQTIFGKDAPTYPKSAGVTAIADGGTAVFSGTDGATGKTRRNFIFQNQGAITLWLTTDGTAGTKGLSVATASPPITLSTSGSVTILNPAGSGGGSFTMLEFFYQ